MSRESGSDKSFTYFALLDAFSKRGCPVCRLLEEYSLSFLDNLFYEQVNDVGTRRKLRDARGFCNWHAWQAKEIASSALGVAIIAKDLLTEEITRLDDLLSGPIILRLQQAPRSRITPESLRAFIQGWSQKGICPACQILLDHERHLLATILNLLHDAEFAHRFASSTALCVTHTIRAAEANGAHPHLRALMEIQRRKYASLLEELEEFCRKHDYRFSHESWGPESDAWLRAIEMLAGKFGLLGSDISRRHSARRPRFIWNLLSWWR